MKAQGYKPFTRSLRLDSSPFPGVVPDRHKRHPRASEPGEAVPGVPRLPQLLPGDGRRETRREQRAAAGQTSSLMMGGLLLVPNVPLSHSLSFSFFVTRSASLPEAGKAPLQSHTSHPGRQGGHEEQSLAQDKTPPPRPRPFHPPFHSTHTFVPNRFKHRARQLAESVSSLWMKQPFKP